MRFLDPIVEPPPHLTPVFDAKILHRCGVGLEPVGDDCGGTAVPLQRLLREPQSRGLVALLGDIAFQDLTYMIDGASQVARLAFDPHKQASGAWEFHPRALSEPDVILSHHPAPVVRPYPCSSGQWANNRGWRCAMRRSQCRDRRL